MKNQKATEFRIKVTTKLTNLTEHFTKRLATHRQAIVDRIAYMEEGQLDVNYQSSHYSTIEKDASEAYTLSSSIATIRRVMQDVSAVETDADITMFATFFYRYENANTVNINIADIINNAIEYYTA